MRNFIIIFSLILLTFVPVVVAQKAATSKIVFAVVNDGNSVEPIAFVEKGKLLGIGEAADTDNTKDFVKRHYKPKTIYNLIFGGKNVGTATVVKDYSDTECSANQAKVTVRSKRVTPKGHLMALATNVVPLKTVKGIRQLPTTPERNQIEALVMAGLKEKGVPIKNTGELRYHNLTKIDVDSDGNNEFVGSYWYNTGEKLRSLFFFIAEKNSENIINISFSNFEEIDEENVMSGEISAVDSGIYHELLLDVLDYDGDGVGEIFTISQAFEGNNFSVYKRVDGKWVKDLDTSNYHCGY